MRGRIGGTFSVSNAGVLAYQLQPGNDQSSLIWFDRAGAQLGTLGPPGSYRHPRLSPDGSRVVVERAQQTDRDLWLMDAARPVPTRFTFDSGNETRPAWSPNGDYVAYGLGDLGASARGLYRKAASGSGDAELLLEGPRNVDDWEATTGGLLYQDFGSVESMVSVGRGMRMLTASGSSEVVATVPAGGIGQARVSADGRWIAYVSTESGTAEVFLSNFPAADWKVRVSTAGGVQPVWRRDGTELFYIAPDGTLMASPLEIDDVRVLPGEPVALFQTRMEGGGVLNQGIGHQYDVTPDGQRFLVNTLVDTLEGDGTSILKLVVNWPALLEEE